VKDTKSLRWIWFHDHGNYLTTESALRGALGAAHAVSCFWTTHAIYVANMSGSSRQFQVTLRRYRS